MRRNQDRIADRDSALAAHDNRFAHERVAANPDERVRQVPKVEDVQLGIVHDGGVVADLNAAGRRVEVDSLVKEYAPAQTNIASVP